MRRGEVWGRRGNPNCAKCQANFLGEGVAFRKCTHWDVMPEVALGAEGFRRHEKYLARGREGVLCVGCTIYGTANDNFGTFRWTAAVLPTKGVAKTWEGRAVGC